ncbi:GpE family phage tail protein [Cernens ardua]
MEDAIADLAVVFHWSPRDVEDMSLGELMEYRERARKRSEVKHGK